MTLLALTGYARSGKDTVGQILVEDYGYHRAAFGDVLKAVAVDTNPIIEVGGDEDTEPARCSISEVLECFGGWENAKDGCPESRQYLVDLGNSLRRRVPGIEVFAALASVPEGVNDVVLTNVYHPEEIAQIQARGGLVFRVTREGNQPANPDEAATARCPVDGVIFNPANDQWRHHLSMNVDRALRYHNLIGERA